ncbi:MAG: PDZ domain-containing protein [Armatimonadetes bacterium]|nr:PDZ domain-containing protein [Armatimonadota bacterium]
MKNALNRPWLILGAGALVIGGVVLGQNLKPGPSIFGNNSPIQLRPAGLNTGVDISNLKALDSTYSALAEAASQAAVFITTETSTKSDSDVMSQLQGAKSGSGFVYRSDGWIVTNDHVVAGYDKVKVVLADGRELTGKVTRANDPQLDLAVVKVDEKDLPTLGVADSSKVRVGQMAMAIGAPFGLEDTVTIGHVSAIGRPGLIPDATTGQVRAYSGLIQTDASINPGNSGGPLIDVNGDVIGVNSAINSPNGTNAGIGFAIPANVVKVVADELITTGKFDRGLLGINPRDLKPYEKKKLSMSGGAYSLSVQKDSAAGKAGIKEGDIVTAIDNVPIGGEIDLRVAMYRHSPNQSVNVTYVRGGQTKTVTVKLDAPQPEPATRSNGSRTPFGNDPNGFFDRMPRQNDDNGAPSTPSTKPKLGVMVQQVDPTARKQYNLPEDAKGVVVATVNDGSFASKVNILAGDVITEINGKPVATVADLTEAMSGVNWGDQVTIKFVRFKNGGRSSYSVTVPFNQ